ncbi:MULTISPECIES: hypothetical protein [Janibacter]|jgi:hypothetical protein|uniref:Uncharacterized protein n=1 Tax=Janibacter melonis TaxID=262209 RepID=A0A176QEX4_9MICO|nr:hypothetical protein [Janibacter melonis]MBD5831275.1 hypothetical protein [Janibacter melonis]MCM3553842.1 hypothetical protein [Janibacter melonis]OAB88264.1 hypothetical protein AWH69_00110 [Janibacter melonis]QFQ31049.1 hypothetical protein EEW87_013145 [Janibacter melonis]
MSTHDDSRPDDQEGGTVSEAGSSALNAETSVGGADNVPETPDVNKGGGMGATVDETDEHPNPDYVPDEGDAPR